MNGTLTLTGATTSPTATLYVNGNFTVGAQNFGSAFTMGQPFTWTDNGAVNPTKLTPSSIMTIPGVTYVGRRPTLSPTTWSSMAVSR